MMSHDNRNEGPDSVKHLLRLAVTSPRRLLAKYISSWFFPWENLKLVISQPSDKLKQSDSKATPSDWGLIQTTMYIKQ